VISGAKSDSSSTAAGTGDVAKKPNDASVAVEAQQKDSYDDFELPKKKKKRRPVSTYIDNVWLTCMSELVIQ